MYYILSTNKMFGIQTIAYTISGGYFVSTSMRGIEISYQLCVFSISKVSNRHEFNCIWLRTKQFLRSINVCMYVYLRFGTPSHPFSLYINMVFAEC